MKAPLSTSGSIFPRRDWLQPLFLLVLAVIGLCIGFQTAVPALYWITFLGLVFLSPLALSKSRLTQAQRAIHASGVEHVGLATCLAVGAFFRLYQLGVPDGIWYDEAQNTLVIQRLLENLKAWPIYISDLSQLPIFAFFFQLPFVFLFPDEATGVRIAAAAAGIASIAIVWLWARQWFSPRVGILSAALVAVSPWHITFSRFGMVQIVCTVVFPLVLVLLSEAIRRRDFRFCGWAGVGAGLGIQTYYACITIVPLGLLALCVLPPGNSSIAATWRHRLKLIIVFLSFVVFSALPVLVFATRNPNLYFERMETVSSATGGLIAQFIKNPNEQHWDDLKPLRESAQAHALMFTVAGDQNGRHNLPGAPMLEPVVGGAFLCGLLISLVRVRRAPSFLLLTLFILTLCSGIFSLSFEAPQAGRTVTNSVVCAVLAAFGLQLLDLRWKDRWQKKWNWISAILLTTFFLWQISYTYDRIFRKQLLMDQVWEAYSGIETKIGRMSNSLAAGETLYTQEWWASGPSISVVSEDPSRIAPFSASANLPLACKPEHSQATFVLDAHRSDDRDAILKLYPDAFSESFTVPGSSWPSYHLVKLSNDAIRSLCLSTDALAPVEMFIKISQPGLAHLLNKGAASVGLRINGRSEILKAGGESSGVFLKGLNRVGVTKGDLAALYFSEGSLPVLLKEIAYRADHSTLGTLLVEYSSAAAGEQMHGFQQFEEIISRQIHLFPLSAPFSITFSGYLKIPAAGLYQFRMSARDKAVLTLGTGSALTSADAELQELQVELKEGKIPIRIVFNCTTGHFYLDLQWIRPGKTEAEIIAPEFLSPADLDNPLN